MSTVNIAVMEIATPKKTVKKHPIKLINHILEHVTTVAHVFIVAFTLFITYICFWSLGFFTWHVILYTIGWMFLMTEAVLMITKDNILSNRITHMLRVRYHWALQVTAVSLSVGGFVVVFISKEDSGQNHFTTLHGISGLVSMVFCIPACINGIAALFNVELSKYISPKTNKFIHAVSGIIVIISGGVAMVTSLYTPWFLWLIDENDNIFILCYVAVCFGIGWCLVRPLITFIQRLKT